MNEIWIIGEGGTLTDGVNFTRVVGTKEDVKQVITTYVNEAKQNDKELWCHGTETVDEIYERDNGALYGYANFYDYHIDWEALPLDKMYTYGD